MVLFIVPLLFPFLRESSGAISEECPSRELAQPATITHERSHPDFEAHQLCNFFRSACPAPDSA